MKLTAPLLLLQTALAAVMPYRSTDDVTPVITAIEARNVDGGVALIATDRYRIGEVQIPDVEITEVTGKIETMLLDAVTVSFIRAVSPKWLLDQKNLSGYTVTVEYPDDRPTVPDLLQSATVTVTVSDGAGNAEQIRTLRALFGNFPPVSRLFPDDEWTPGLGENGTIMLSPDFLSDLSLTARALTGRPRGHRAVAFTFYQDGTGSARRPRPALVRFRPEEYGATKLSARVLIQPVIPPQG